MNHPFWKKSLMICCALLFSSSVMSASAQALSSQIESPQPVPHPVDHVNGTNSIFFLNTDGNATYSNIAMDNSGGMHIAASPMGAASNGTYPAYYGYCTSNCSHPSGWTILQLENLGFWGGFVRLALTSTGHPRMIWTRELTSGNGEYRYAECDTQCTNIANWKITSTGPSFNADDSQYFALDNLGHPRLIYYDYNSTHRGIWYRFCNSTCTNSANWYETNLTTELLMRPSLVFTSSGQPRFVADYVGDTSRLLRYYACDTSCSNSDNWYYLVLAYSNADNSFSLHMDHSNRPRIALYTGYNGLTDDNLLEYWWCNASCIASSNNWGGYIIGFDPYYGLEPDLVFDSTNQPSIAFYADTDPYGLVYTNCTANCETYSPTWNYQVIETSAELNAIDPVPVKPGCSTSSWFPGQSPSLALSADQPYFGFDAQHVQGGTCPAETDINLIRVATPGAGGANNVYLPIVIR